ncbi:MAG: hypothetical protein A2106_06330 [Planctomycetes bacterium GWF2_40_8]|nr:MAG: hypothetical protein A2106_06330 [Planctomycetes bacterium GWF2_40_8]OHB87142.1 MAG: hypothetical protein A3D13_05230 [Planctomycetes bacterium RIFCSPHIGHO2_02_FULL_40_12]OHC01973.1 MAG: hypothetical protein A3H23_04960 [Planctomycetes bacterium RIFCSPLOWO2_12_FULL_40_19]
MFGKEKESKEFFEVFRNQGKQEGTKYNSKIFQRKQENPTVIPKLEPKKNQEITDEDKNTEQLGWIMNTQSEGKFQSGTQGLEKFQTGVKKIRKLFLNEVVLKQETLIFGALGAVFLSLTCFFVGYKIGHKDVLNPEMLQEPVVHHGLDGRVKALPPGSKIKAVDLSLKQSPIPTVKQEQNVKWTLQIISYSNTKQHLKQATNLAKAIKNMTGYNTFVAKRGNELVVCTGKFNSRDSDEIKKTLSEISKLEYEGKKQFANSYPIQIR